MTGKSRSGREGTRYRGEEKEVQVPGERLSGESKEKREAVGALLGDVC